MPTVRTFFLLVVLASAAAAQQPNLEFTDAGLTEVVDAVARHSGERFLLPSLPEERKAWSSVWSSSWLA